MVRPDRPEYDEAVLSAHDALLEALSEAGIELDLEDIPQMTEGEFDGQNKPAFNNETAPAQNGNLQSNAPANDNTLNKTQDEEVDGFIAKLGNWLKSLFNK